MKKIVLLAAVFMMITCASKPSVTVNESFDGKDVVIKKGEFFEVKLQGQPGTGYGWKLTSMPDFIEEKEKPSREPIKKEIDKAGGFEYLIFRYNALKEGEATLEYTYARHWDKKDKTVNKTFNLKITVK